MNRPLTRPPATLSPIGGENRPNFERDQRPSPASGPLTRSHSPSAGERVPEGRVRGSSDAF